MGKSRLSMIHTSTDTDVTMSDAPAHIDLSSGKLELIMQLRHNDSVNLNDWVKDAKIYTAKTKPLVKNGQDLLQRIIPILKNLVIEIPDPSRAADVYRRPSIHVSLLIDNNGASLSKKRKKSGDEDEVVHEDEEEEEEEGKDDDENDKGYDPDATSEEEADSEVDDTPISFERKRKEKKPVDIATLGAPYMKAYKE
ncbi:hypothetical protein HDV00_011254 [Rhizophlyctis rosea]|nr:hypothetical protein HDV00_011254 [Rhizophlyctis rosea]